MSARQSMHACTWPCSWKGTAMCAQRLVNAQTLEDGRLTLAVLCGVKQLYRPHPLPSCIVKTKMDWSGAAAEPAQAAA